MRPIALRSALRTHAATLSILVAAVVVHATGLSAALIFQRTEILSGEVWRVLGGSFVHYSNVHLLYNCVVVAACGLLIERQRLPDHPLLFLCVGSAAAIGLGILVLRPDVEVYAGLSGVACALVSYLALNGLRTPGLGRRASALVLVALCAKLWFEAVTGTALFAADGAHPLLPESHLLGAAFAAGLFVWNERVRRWRGSVASNAPRHGRTLDVAAPRTADSP